MNLKNKKGKRLLLGQQKLTQTPKTKKRTRIGLFGPNFSSSPQWGEGDRDPKSTIKRAISVEPFKLILISC